MRYVLFIFSTLVFLGCGSAALNQAVVNQPKPALERKVSPEASLPNDINVATNTFGGIKAQCSFVLSQPAVKSDPEKFSCTLGICAKYCDALLEHIRKLKARDTSRLYEKQLDELIASVEYMSRVYSGVKACMRPGATQKEILKCIDELGEKLNRK